MKVLKIVLMICLFGSISSHLLLNFEDRYGKISSYIRDIMVQINSQSHATNDVVILPLIQFSKMMQTIDDIYDAIITQIPKENIITTPSTNQIVENKHMRKASVIIIISDTYSTQFLIDSLIHSVVSNYWDHMAKFIFVSTHLAKGQLTPISEAFQQLCVLNAIIIGTYKDTQLVYSFNPFEEDVTNQFYEIEGNSREISKLFPDKTKNLKGYKYETMSQNSYPSIYVNKEGKFEGTMLNFIKTVSKHQNTTSHDVIVAKRKNFYVIKRKLANGEIDTSLTPVLSYSTKNSGPMKMVNTFETDGFCAILPHPERKSFLSYVFKPYDTWTWILISATVIIFVIVWHFLNKHARGNPNTAGYMIFAFYAFFIGQGVEFRENRLLQKILVQLMVMMTFILGNAYQSVLTSFMMESRYGDRISTIEELIESNYTLKVDEIFNSTLIRTDDYMGLHSKITSIFKEEDFQKLGEIAANKTGVVLMCNVIDTLFKSTDITLNVDRNTIDHFYRLPQKFYSFYKFIPTATFSPLADKLQDYSLRIFESGIKQHWSTMISLEDMSEVKKRESIANEEFYFNLEDMMGAFYCLGVGLALAFVAFVFEGLWFRYFQYFSLRAFKKNVGRIWRRWRNRNKVQPRLFIRARERV